jgi:sugar O-acyltransferase (sialic acid O-acetyltransferase NeuD family)
MSARNRATGLDNNAGCVIIGAGGHASVLIDCIRAAGNTGPIVALDQDVRMHGKEFHGVEILGGDNEMDRLAGQKMGFAIGVGTTGRTDVRTALYGKALACGLVPVTAIHPSAVIAFDVELGEGGQIFARSVINTGTTVGHNVIVNTGAIVEHDCQIEEDVHIAPGACLGGEVLVGAGAHIGIGAVVLNGISIGAQSVIGGGAVVIRDVAPGATVVGNPAKPIQLPPSR